MKNKKIFLSSIILVIGVVLILFAFLFKNSQKTKEHINNLSFRNLEVTSNNSFTIEVTNNSNKKIDYQKVMLYLQDENKKVIMSTPFEIENLGSKKTKKMEYYQENNFRVNPVSAYAKKYNENELIIENVSLDSKLADILKNTAKSIVEENFANLNSLNLTITALEMENKYKKDLGEFKKENYACSLTESFVVIEMENHNYQYTTYISCKN